MAVMLGTEKGKRRCDHCGSVYEVMVSRFADRHSGSHTCEVCGNLIEWQSILVPSQFKLIKRPDGTLSFVTL